MKTTKLVIGASLLIALASVPAASAHTTVDNITGAGECGTIGSGDYTVECLLLDDESQDGFNCAVTQAIDEDNIDHCLLP